MDVVVYTMARKFPRLIGKFPNGQTIPFGPFTFVQIGVLIGGLAITFATIQILGAPKLPTAVIAAFLIVPAMAAIVVAGVVVTTVAAVIVGGGVRRCRTVIAD